MHGILIPIIPGRGDGPIMARHGVGAGDGTLIRIGDGETRIGDGTILISDP